jgi:hypothetical protein
MTRTRRDLIRKVVILGAASRPPAVATFVGNASSSDNLTTYDFGDFAVGVEGLVIVRVVGKSNVGRTVASASIGGGSGSLHAPSSSLQVPTAIASGVGSGSVNVSVTFSDVMQGGLVSVTVLRGYLSTTPRDTDTAIGATANGNSISATLDIPKGGVGFYSHGHFNAEATAWSAAAERADVSVESIRLSTADKSASGALPANLETASWPTNAVRSMSAASWR